MAKLASVLVVDDNPRCLEFTDARVHGAWRRGSEKRDEAGYRARSHPRGKTRPRRARPEDAGTRWLRILSLLRSEGNPVPIVMCSGSALQKDIDRAYAGGCSGYVEKPATMEDYRIMAGAIVEYWRRASCRNTEV